MNTTDLPIAFVSQHTFTLGELLKTAHRREMLVPMLEQALTERVLVAAAHQIGLAVSDEEVRQSVDELCQLLGLVDSQALEAWMKVTRMSLADLHGRVESDLLQSRLREHLTVPYVQEYFAAQYPEYRRARLRLILAESEQDANDLYRQLVEERRNFSELASLYSTDVVSRPMGGDLGELFRCQLAPHEAEMIFQAQPGDIVGPLLVDLGHAIYLVEELHEAQLDEITTEMIKQAIFDTWLKQQMAVVHLDFAWLEAIG